MRRLVLANTGGPAAAPLPLLPLLPRFHEFAERDEAFRPGARAALRALYPAAEVHLFAGAGHGVMATRTAEYTDAVREFLRKT